MLVLILDPLFIVFDCSAALQANWHHDQEGEAQGFL